jgi:hypothetical protein
MLYSSHVNFRFLRQYLLLVPNVPCVPHVPYKNEAEFQNVKSMPTKQQSLKQRKIK